MPKSAIHTANAEARRKDIDEGAKLAKRIDGLRETLADEEASLEKFRVATTANIKAEIAPLEEKLGGLKKEVGELERTRAQLLIPLDAEWEKVEAEKAIIEQQKHDVGEIQKQAEQDKSEAAELLKTAQQKAQQATYNEEETERTLGKARQDRTDAARTLEQARLQKIRTEREHAAKLHPLTVREQRCEKKEEWVKIKEQEIREEKSKIAKEWRLLRDRQATLERNIKRFNQ